MTDVIDNDDTITTGSELRDLLGRINRLLEVPGQLAATDANGNPSTVAAGGLIESAWGNATSERTVFRFPTVAAMKAWAPADGTSAATGNRLFMRVNGTWQTSGMTSLVKTSSSEFLNFTAAEFGLATINYLSVDPQLGASNTVFVAGTLVAVGGATAASRVYYVNGTALALVGNGSSVTVTVSYQGVV